MGCMAWIHGYTTNLELNAAGSNDFIPTFSTNSSRSKGSILGTAIGLTIAATASAKAIDSIYSNQTRLGWFGKNIGNIFRFNELPRRYTSSR
jgi:hypothetical protein